MPDANEILSRWEAVCEAATKGDWHPFGHGNDCDLFGPPSPTGRKRITKRQDMEFCAAARTSWPATIRALKVAMDELWVYGGKDEYDRPTSAAKALAEIQAILEGRDDVS